VRSVFDVSVTLHGVVLGTNVDFMFPVQTEDDDDDDADADGVDVGASEDHLSEVAGISVHDLDAPTDVDKSSFEFYG